jgi:hypothetical protein
MPLAHTQPPEALLRELHEVAHDACALMASLTTEINFPLPPDFPKDQLLDISRSLAQLPIGTAEGCRAPLEYARNRLPAIRREYVLSEELDGPTNNADATPVVLRNSLIDERLRHLIASVSTALDEYRRLTFEELLDEPTLEREIIVPSDDAEPAITQSLRLERELTSASEAVQKTTSQNSQPAGNLKRQIHDAEGVNRLARAELRMPKMVVRWHRRLVDFLRESPSLIRRTADTLELGVDVADISIERWHDFKRNSLKLVTDEIRKTCDAFRAVADKLEQKSQSFSRRPPADASEDSLPFDTIFLLPILDLAPPNIPYSYLGNLTPSMIRLLEANRIVYLGDLVSYSELELLRLGNIGRATVRRIFTVLFTIGLRLSTQVPGWPPENVAELAEENHSGALSKLSERLSTYNARGTTLTRSPTSRL